MAMFYYHRTGEQVYYLAAVGIFALAVISDGLDGYFARSRNLHSELGKIIDPLADKLLLNIATVLLTMGIGRLFRIPLWFTVLIISRDLMIVGGSVIIVFLRGNVEVKPTSIGKIAAVGQMVTVIWILLFLPYPILFVYVAAALAVASIIPYLRFGLNQLEDKIVH